jgi:hypothetical protein
MSPGSQTSPALGTFPLGAHIIFDGNQYKIEGANQFLPISSDASDFWSYFSLAHSPLDTIWYVKLGLFPAATKSCGYLFGFSDPSTRHL